MVICLCGEMLATMVGDGFVYDNQHQIRWMRRRSDLLSCASCGQSYAMEDLQELAASPPSMPADGSSHG